MSDPSSVTLAIPCYNAASFLDGVLSSVAALDPAPGEVLVVDDGSTDGSGSVATGYPGVRVIRHETNAGIAAARNTAIQNARKPIILFLDADTRPSSDIVAKLARHYGEDDVAGVGGRGLETHVTDRSDRWRNEILFQGWGEDLRASVPFLFGLCSSYRKKALIDVGGFNPLFRVSGEDMDAGYRLTSKGYRLIYEPEARVDHVRKDDAQSVGKMAYRHCFWGFTAQRMNHRYENKVTLSQSAWTLLRQLAGSLLRGDLGFLGLTLRLHGMMLRAWLDSGRYVRARGKPSAAWDGSQVWEGHDRAPEA
ncbi:MAG: glycosyltransferase family 2 protein [bacterium]|nr:MAG: glycosyltransferase family 2 protein [bacterium]